MSLLLFVFILRAVKEKLFFRVYSTKEKISIIHPLGEKEIEFFYLLVFLLIKRIFFVSLFFLSPKRRDFNFKFFNFLSLGKI